MYGIISIDLRTNEARLVDSNHFNLDYANRALNRLRAGQTPGSMLSYLLGEVIDVSDTDPMDPIALADVLKSHGGIILNAVPRSEKPAYCRVMFFGIFELYYQAVRVTRPNAVLTRIKAPVHTRSRV